MSVHRAGRSDFLACSRGRNGPRAEVRCGHVSDCVVVIYRVGLGRETHR